MNSVDFEVLLCNRLTITGEMVTELLAFTDLHPPPPTSLSPLCWCEQDKWSWQWVCVLVVTTSNLGSTDPQKITSIEVSWTAILAVLHPYCLDDELMHEVVFGRCLFHWYCWYYCCSCQVVLVVLALTVGVDSCEAPVVLLAAELTLPSLTAGQT